MITTGEPSFFLPLLCLCIAISLDTAWPAKQIGMSVHPAAQSCGSPNAGLLLLERSPLARWAHCAVGLTCFRKDVTLKCLCAGSGTILLPQ